MTHEMGFARELANHICFTDRGVIVEHGPPATFFTEAKDPRTREFLSRILWPRVAPAPLGSLRRVGQASARRPRSRAAGRVDGRCRRLARKNHRRPREEKR